MTCMSFQSQSPISSDFLYWNLWDLSPLKQRGYIRSNKPAATKVTYTTGMDYCGKLDDDDDDSLSSSME